MNIHENNTEITVNKILEETKSGFSTRKILIALLALVVFLFLFLQVYYSTDLWMMLTHSIKSINETFFVFVAAGFVAQLIDGSLGMAYGVSASTFLLSFGVSPAATSASIHTSEIFTSGVSGFMHLKFKNVNKKLFVTLLIPGVVGAIIGAYVLSSLQEYNYLFRPVVATYTLALGIIIINKALRNTIEKKKTKNVQALATFGGFMDSVGGGGWGPIVATTLIARGRHPRYTVGSVNLTEFFVSLASSITFFFVIGISHLHIIAGLILGGIIAAPIAASLTRKLPVKKMMLVVGALVILVSLRLIFISFW
jgi:uncharacterized protein